MSFQSTFGTVIILVTRFLIVGSQTLYTTIFPSDEDVPILLIESEKHPAVLCFVSGIPLIMNKAL